MGLVKGKKAALALNAPPNSVRVLVQEKAKAHAAWAAKAHLVEVSIIRGKTQSSTSSEHSPDEGEGKEVESRAARAANAHLTKVRLVKKKKQSSASSERALDEGEGKAVEKNEMQTLT